VFEDPNLREILNESYIMYSYYYCKIDGKSNLSWCRTMYYSLIQQIVRGDLLYWLYYAVL
jgi:hypothetical protein